MVQLIPNFLPMKSKIKYFLPVFVFLLAYIAVLVRAQDPDDTFIRNIMLGDLEAVGKMIDEGADPNQVIDSRNTPLIFAAYGGNPDLIMLLISRGFWFSIFNQNGLKKSLSSKH